VITMDTSHSPFFSAPETLVAHLTLALIARGGCRSATGGIGMSLFFAPWPMSSSRPCAVMRMARLSGVNNTIARWAVFGVAVLASIFASVGGYASPSAFTDGLIAAMWVGATGSRGGIVPLSGSRVGRLSPSTVPPFR